MTGNESLCRLSTKLLQKINYWYNKNNMARDILNAKQVAKYFIWKSQSEEKPITNKKLQKLLYYAQAWSLVLRNKKLFSDKIEAWVHGPAIRDVYFEYRKFGFGPISENVRKNDLGKISENTKEFLDQVWSVYGKKDAAFLEYLSHSETPWQKAREGLEPHIGSENEISLEDMREFYGSKVKK
jgi:uncharacterized phage-associated protein